MIGYLGLCYLPLQANQHDGIVWSEGFRRHERRDLPSGLVLLVEDRFYEQGNLDRVRLTWYRRHASKLRKVKSFEGLVRLDDLPAVVQGDRVYLKTLDEQHAFMVTNVDDTFGRESTWQVEHGRPRLTNLKVYAPRLRIVDAAIWHSWSTKHPSPIQKRLKRAWTRPCDLENWTETRYGETWALRVDDTLIFTLRRGSSGQWNVVGVRESRKVR